MYIYTGMYSKSSNCVFVIDFLHTK